jgi:hypothetical protein
MNRLTEIANEYNCDKGTIAYEAHGYTEMYKNYIPSQNMYKLLEIGVWKGDSLRMWKQYNPQLIVHGVDINPLVNHVEGAVIHTGSQSDYSFITNLVVDICPDFVIDDGSHRYVDIMSTFMFIYPLLEKGTYYFIEDLHASYAEREKVKRDIGRITSFVMECNEKLLILRK